MQALPSFLKFWLLPLLVILLCGFAVATHLIVVSFALVAIVAASLALPFWFRLRPLDVIYIWVGLLVFADGDYPDATNASAILFQSLFGPLVSGTFSVFEMVTFGLTGWLVIKGLSNRLDGTLRSDTWWVVCVAACAAFATGLVGAVHGLGNGGEVRILLWQLRSFPVFSCWAVIGFLALASVEDASKFIRVMVLCTFIKSLQNLEVLLVDHHGALGPKTEYLSSHIASFYMAITMVALVLRIFYQSQRVRLFDVGALAFIFYLWVVNNRRVSILGITFTVLFSILFIYPYITRAHLRRAFVGLIVLGIFAGATWGGPHGFGSLFVKPLGTPVDYRDIENYDLFRTIGEFPLTGRGYGFAFKQYMALPDIGFDHTELLTWVPHNNILMIWSFGGPLALAGLGMSIALFLAVMVRLFNLTDDLQTKVFAYIGFSTFIQWTMYIWADMAFAFKSSLMIPGIIGGFGFKLLLLYTRQQAAAGDGSGEAKPPAVLAGGLVEAEGG